jgi:hypothetical protein
MKKATLTLIALAALASNAFAGTYHVSYSLRGSGHKITMRAESTSEARRTVQAIIPGAVVTNAHRVSR